jgi:hypothetical protein
MNQQNNIEVQLIRAVDGTSMTAQLVPLAAKHSADFNQSWREQLITSTNEDQYWDWERKQQIYLSSAIGAFEGYAIECEQITQGMMIIQTSGHRSQIDPERRLVYVHSLATAPWNRLNTGSDGFRAVGRTLLQFARFRSEELGCGGLVGVHSLLGAEEFYLRMGMIDGGVDAEKENLRYFEWYRRRLFQGEED